jgi:hypothetical protein
MRRIHMRRANTRTHLLLVLLCHLGHHSPRHEAWQAQQPWHAGPQQPRRSSNGRRVVLLLPVQLQLRQHRQLVHELQVQRLHAAACVLLVLLLLLLRGLVSIHQRLRGGCQLLHDTAQVGACRCCCCLRCCCGAPGLLELCPLLAGLL